MKDLFSNIKNNYQKGDSFKKLLYINLCFFIIYMIIHVPQAISSLENEIPEIDKFINTYLAFSSQTESFIYKPWTILTYMFIHTNLLHIIFNMIWLYFGSKLFLQKFNNRQLISTYILGGISGGIFFKLIFSIFPYFNESSPLIGSSASIVAIIIAISTYSPNYSIILPFFRNIKLKYIAWISIFLFYINIESNNPGGNIAHLGGALYGYLYIILLNQGFDLSINLQKFIKLFSFTKRSKERDKKRRSEKVSDDVFRTKKADTQKKINLILEKISKSGYESLTTQEKEILFKESKK